MTKTLITDGFEDETPKPIRFTTAEPHVIVYGSKDWTDALDAQTIETLVAVGAISFVRSIEHDAAETRLYVSRQGNAPA